LFSFDEIESLLVAQEAQLERFKQSGYNFSLNFTWTNSRATFVPNDQVADTHFASSRKQFAHEYNTLGGYYLIKKT